MGSSVPDNILSSGELAAKSEDNGGINTGGGDVDRRRLLQTN